MKDHDSAVDVDLNDEETATNVALFTPDIDGADMGAHQMDVARRASNASYSLGRLEQDLKLLNMKWQAVEKEMSDKDGQIADVHMELAKYENKSDELESDLADLRAERDAFADDLQQKRDELDGWKARESEADRTILARESELESLRDDYQLALTEKRSLEDELEKGKAAVASADGRQAQLDSQNTELRVHVQELQDYIDGRKTDWGKLKLQVREYEDTLKGISSSLDSHDEVIARKEAEKAGLALKVMELERELAELKGRHKENSNSQAELQQTLDDQSRELGGLNAEVIRLNKDLDKLQKKLGRRDSTVRSLRRDIKDRGSDSSELKGQLATETAASVELRDKLDAANSRIDGLLLEQKERESSADDLGVTIGELRERLHLAEPTIEAQGAKITDLEESLRESQGREEELRGRIDKSAAKADHKSARATEFEIRAAELEAELLELRAERQDVEQELEAQRELVDVLEAELRKKQDDLDLLDRSVDRLSAISTGVRELDVQIDDHWCEQPKSLFDQSEPLFEQPDEVFLQPEELFSDPADLAEHVIVSEDDESGEPVRYPLLQDEMTIGRSRKSDIRINSKYISRLHAKIKVEDGRATIEDAGSTNGFLVNSEHSTCHTLAHGDKLEIGKNKFQYLVLSQT